MSANKSIIEEALLEAKQIEEAVKTNTKEILAKTMMPEIEEMVKESLTETEEGLEEVVEEQVTENEESVTENAPINEDEDEESEEVEMEAGEESEEMEAGEDSDEEEEEASAEIEMGGEMEMPSIMDLTSSTDEEVIKVFKELSDDDEVEVVGDVVKIKASEPSEYRVEVPSADMDESTAMEEETTLEEENIDEDEAIYEIELTEEELNEIESIVNEEEVVEEEAVTEEEVNEEEVNEEETVTEEELEEGGAKKGDQSKTHSDYKNYKGTDKGYHGKDGESHGDQGEPDDYMEEEEEEMEEASRTHGFGSKKGRGLRKAISNNRNLELNEEVETELAELKAKNEEYKEALKVFRNKLNEIAVFNSNLAYATKLFMEHSTTKAEKMDILKRFDNVSTIKESKSLYKTIEGEMGTKAPVTESIEKTIKAPKAGAVIKEDTAYVDPQVARMKLLMEKLG